MESTSTEYLCFALEEKKAKLWGESKSFSIIKF